MNYTYDARKLASNVAKHGVWFYELDAFEWETAAIAVDLRRYRGEIRFIVTGLISHRVYVLVFCFRETRIRIISLRKANLREARRYARDH